MKFQVHSLRLVYPPVSNQEAEWIKEDTEVKAALRQSNLYMIGMRPEAKFQNLRAGRNSGLITFDLSTAEGASTSGSIDYNEILRRRGWNGDTTLELELGEKMFRLWDTDRDGKPTEVLSWFTTEKLLFDRWRGAPGIKGLDSYRDLTRYHLLYVGIAKEDDSYSRLLAKGHERRVAILSNETQSRPGARLTDELYIFFFTVDALQIRQYEFGVELPEDAFEVKFEREKIIADAEKAFVKLLQSKYNQIRYQQYPRGKDGLYGTGLARYGYAIAEDLTLVTEAESFNGGYDAYLPCSNDADFILVQGDDVVIVRPPVPRSD